MGSVHEDICETHVLGEGTREFRLDAGRCPVMRPSHLLWAGWSEAREGYRFERLDPPFSGLITCYGGRGRVWVDDGWKTCGPGTAYLLPPHVRHAYYADPAPAARLPWGICWAAFDAPVGHLPLVTATAPTLVRCDPEPLRSVTAGLQREWMTAADPAATEHWVWLIRRYVERIARPARLDDRLWQVWAAVDADLAHPWTADRLSELAHLSKEQVRRLCRQQVGRSPMQHVTHLRVQHAAALLASTGQKVSAVARAVGYEDPFAFAVAFKRCTGLPPSKYRR